MHEQEIKEQKNIEEKLDNIKYDFHRLDEKFVNRDSAEKLADQWKKKGYQTKIESKNFSGTIVYLVYIHKLNFEEDSFELKRIKYYCPICKSHHFSDSEIGIEHMETMQENRAIEQRIEKYFENDKYIKEDEKQEIIALAKDKSLSYLKY